MLEGVKSQERKFQMVNREIMIVLWVLKQILLLVVFGKKEEEKIVKDGVSFGVIFLKFWKVI